MVYLVIALDTPLEPIGLQQTQHLLQITSKQVRLRWCSGLQQLQVRDACKSSYCNVNLNDSQPSVGVLRDQGFLSGFGIDVKDVSNGVTKMTLE